MTGWPGPDVRTVAVAGRKVHASVALRHWLYSGRAQMRRFLVGLAIFTSGVIGLVGTALLEQLLTNQVLGPGHSVSDWEPLMQVFLMVLVVLPPLLVAAVLLPRGRTTEVGLFLLGWGCIWPVLIAYLVLGTMAARLFGAAGPVARPQQ